MSEEVSGRSHRLKPMARSAYLGLAVTCGAFLLVWNVAVRVNPAWLTSETGLLVLVAIAGMVAGIGVLFVGRFVPTLAPNALMTPMEVE